MEICWLTRSPQKESSPLSQKIGIRTTLCKCCFCQRVSFSSNAVTSPNSVLDIDLQGDFYLSWGLVRENSIHSCTILIDIYFKIRLIIKVILIELVIQRCLMFIGAALLQC